MGRTTGSVPNLINGISQQSPSMRLPSQAERSENYHPTITDGLTKRPPTDHLAVLLASFAEDTFTHFILRDENEKYVVAITTAGLIRVWDFQGNEKTVNNTSPGYLAGLTSGHDDITALTLVDHTFIVNKKRKVLAGTAIEPLRPYEALVNVAAGNYGRLYRIYLKGTLAGEMRTPNGADESDTNWIDTVNIAGRLYNAMANGIAYTGGNGHYENGPGGYNTGTPWALGRYGSTLYIRNNTADFVLTTEDGYNGRAMIPVKGSVQKFADLPLQGHDGVVIEVAGTDTTGFDNYWVKFEKATDGDTSGVWRECIKPGTTLGLNAATMPHQLVREANGTFTFKAAEWAERHVGDIEKSPDPSFVGQTIEDVFYHKNRLGFLTQENIVMSQAGKFYDFYRASLTVLLDTDPIDVAASHTKVSLLRHAILFQKELFAFSDSTQFVVKGNELLTPKTVNGDPLTELSASSKVRPVTAATSIYFISERERWASLYEYFIDKALEAADYDDVSGHAPNYIPAGVHKLIASPDLDLVLVATSGDPGAIYVYKFFYNGDQKLQSAWVRWVYPNATKIVNMEFDRGKVRLLVKRGNALHLESFNAEQSITDPGLNYVTYLDQRVVKATGVLASGKTTFTLPFPAPVGMKCVTAPGGASPPGVELAPVSVTGTAVVFDGNLSAQPVRFGVPYESRHRFSQFYQRTPDQKQVEEDGRLQVIGLNITYTKTAYFRAEVTCEGRPMRTYIFNGRIISDANNQTGVLAIRDGRMSIPIMSRSDRVTVDLVNDTWLPCAFVNAKWRGTWNPNTREQ